MSSTERRMESSVATMTSERPSISEAARRPRLHIEPSRALPLVHVVISFRAGSVHDPEGREGLARLAARMLRRGSVGLSSDEVEIRADSLGGEFGCDASLSVTTLSFEVIRRSLDPFVDLMVHVLGKPAFEGAELDRLVRKTKAEIVEARDSDRSLAGRALRRTVHEGHPYGRRTSGTAASLERITARDVREAYARVFVRENARVAVSGDVTHEEAEALTDRLLAALPEGAPAPYDVAEPVTRPGRTLVVVDKPGRTQTQLGVGMIGSPPSDPLHVPLAVANTAFGGTFTSRLMQEIRVKRGWSYGAGSSMSYDRRRDLFSMWTAPKLSDAPDCLALLLELLEALVRDGVSETELDFAKRYLVRSHAFEIDTAKKRVHQALEEVLYDLPEGFHARWLERVGEVTVESAAAAVGRLTPNDLVVSVVGQASSLVPALSAKVPFDRTIVLPVDFE